MNALDMKLCQSNFSIVLGCIKIFMKFAAMMPNIAKNVCERIKGPLLTMLGSNDSAYIALAHFKAITEV